MAIITYHLKVMTYQLNQPPDIVQSIYVYKRKFLLRMDLSNISCQSLLFLRIIKFKMQSLILTLPGVSCNKSPLFLMAFLVNLDGIQPCQILWQPNFRSKSIHPFHHLRSIRDHATGIGWGIEHI